MRNARFVPGGTIGDRYRIVGLIGKGGMGEVYRADDLKLGHPVALKVLIAPLAHDRVAVARFYSEVRIARQISHPNICRVYDIGDADGTPFLSMEYIEGEDLGSLLRRIGRLPPYKALEIARQLCAGLAAAHEHGVLHRDLKPSNIMIDARSKPRLTDFGLAGLLGDLCKTELIVGTPAYMSPEQLSGRGVTVQSDIYSLGLVLYEMFTGKRAFESPIGQEVLPSYPRSTPTRPLQIVTDIHPPIEHAILKCLENDVRNRPSSVQQVTAMLDSDPTRWQRVGMEVDEARRLYVREIGSSIDIRSQRLIDALANVQREHFLGAGPWTVRKGVPSRATEETDPKHLYQDVSVVIDADRDLHNGSPSTVAPWLDAADIREGDRVFHLGCGVGYYTAIIAEIVGPKGHVIGIEIDEGLASRARENLGYLSNVEVLAGDGGEYDPGRCDVVLIHAGVTHPRSVWPDRLRPGGRLLVPLTFELSGTRLSKGAVLVVRHTGLLFAASFIPQPLIISSCTSVRDAELNQNLLNGFRANIVQSVRSLRRGSHERDSTCCLHSDRFCFCLSKQSPSY
jgi:serine/threonine protein kinase